MTSITRPLTSIKTVNTLIITELWAYLCRENWKLGVLYSSKFVMFMLKWYKLIRNTSARSRKMINCAQSLNNIDILIGEPLYIFLNHFGPSQVSGVVFRVLNWCYFSNLIFPISQILSVSHGAMTWRGLITGYLQCGATLIRAWNNATIFHILSVSVWRGCGIRVMWIIWERNGRRRVHDLSQTRKLGCFLFSPVCNLLVMLNTPR